MSEKMPEWIERYEKSVALSQDDFKLAEALRIAWEALEQDLVWKSIKGSRQGAREALSRIRALGRK